MIDCWDEWVYSINTSTLFEISNSQINSAVFLFREELVFIQLFPKKKTLKFRLP